MEREKKVEEGDTRHKVLLLHAHCDSKTLQPQKLGGLADDGVLLGEGHVLEAKGVRSGDLSTGDTDSGGSQVVETVLHGQSKDLGGNTEHGVAGLDGHQAASLLERGNDGLNIEGLDGAQVDNLGLDAVLLLELGGGSQGLADAAGEGDDGQVLAGTLNLGLANGQDEVALLGGLAHGEGLTVHKPIKRRQKFVSYPLIADIDPLISPISGEIRKKKCIWPTYSFSRTTTGLGSRIAAFRRPLASSELQGETTLRPGMLPYQAE